MEPHFRIFLSSNSKLNETKNNKTIQSPSSVLSVDLIKDSSDETFSNNSEISTTPLSSTTVISENLTLPPAQLSSGISAESTNASSFRGDHLTSSTLQSTSKDPLTEEDVGAEGIGKDIEKSTDSTTAHPVSTVSFDYTTVGYITLRPKQNEGNINTAQPMPSSTKESSHHTESFNEATTVTSFRNISVEPFTSRTFGFRVTARPYLPPSSAVSPNGVLKELNSIGTESTTNNSIFPGLIPSTSGSESLLRNDTHFYATSVRRNMSRSESTTTKLDFESVTDKIVLSPINTATTTNKPKVTFETVTDAQEYSYYISSSAELKNPNNVESLNYLPPPQPALSLRLPNDQSTSTAFNLRINESSQNSQSRLPIHYLPPRAK
jgi:hypothetical protein